MKRLFWSLFGAILGAIAVWFFARRHMDTLYGEVSRLQEYERKEQRMNARYAKKNADRRKEKEAELAAMTPEERIDYEMRQAEINSFIKSQIGEKIYNELTAGERDSDDS